MIELMHPSQQAAKDTEHLATSEPRQRRKYFQDPRFRQPARTSVAATLAGEFRQGRPIADLAADHNLSLRMTRSLLDEAGVTDYFALLGVPQEKWAQLLAARWKAGETSAALIRTTGLSLPKVRQLLGSTGLDTTKGRLPHLPVEDILAMHAAGVPLAAIGEKHNTSAGTIQRLLDRNATPEASGIRPRQRGRSVIVDKADRAARAKELADLYDGNATITELAEMTGFSRTFTRTLIIEGGASIRDSPHATLAGHERVAARKTARTLYERGTSTRAVAETLDLSETMVWKLLHEAGTPMRRPGGRRDLTNPQPSRHQEDITAPRSC